MTNDMNSNVTVHTQFLVNRASLLTNLIYNEIKVRLSNSLDLELHLLLWYFHGNRRNRQSLSGGC